MYYQIEFNINYVYVFFYYVAFFDVLPLFSQTLPPAASRKDDCTTFRIPVKYSWIFHNAALVALHMRFPFTSIVRF